MGRRRSPVRALLVRAKSGRLHLARRIDELWAGLDPNEKVELKVLPKPENPLEELFGANLDEEREAKILGGISHLVPGTRGMLQRAYQLQKVMQEPVTLIMPYWLEVK